MPRFMIDFSGHVDSVEADTPEGAWKSVEKYLNCYVFKTVKQIGVEVDEFGYPMEWKGQYPPKGDKK